MRRGSTGVSQSRIVSHDDLRSAGITAGCNILKGCGSKCSTVLHKFARSTIEQHDVAGRCRSWADHDPVGIPLHEIPFGRDCRVVARSGRSGAVRVTDNHITGFNFYTVYIARRGRAIGDHLIRMTLVSGHGKSAGRRCSKSNSTLVHHRVADSQSLGHCALYERCRGYLGGISTIRSRRSSRSSGKSRGSLRCILAMRVVLAHGDTVSVRCTVHVASRQLHVSVGRRGADTVGSSRRCVR